MQNKRCFLCGHKMLESGLCSNADCVRSQPVIENKNSENAAPSDPSKTPVTQAESGSDA